MSECPNDLKYTESHEWVRSDDEDSVTVGITDHAQCQLGELVFVEVPEVGKIVAAGDEIAVVESVKTASDVYTPLSGRIIEVNERLADEPQLVNQEPYTGGWLFRLKIEEADELEDLMDADDYQASIEE